MICEKCFIVMKFSGYRKSENWPVKNCKNGTIWIIENEDENKVMQCNYCPICGNKAKVSIEETQRNHTLEKLTSLIWSKVP